MTALSPPEQAEADICLIVEGCYPYVAGGVSTWLDWLIRSQPETRFAVVALVADERPMTCRYQLPENVVAFQDLPLSRQLPKPVSLREPRLDPRSFCDLLCKVIVTGDLDAFTDLNRMLQPPMLADGVGPDEDAVSLEQLLNTRFGWTVMTRVYDRLTPSASFPDFFWAWRTLIGGLYAVLKAPLPAARAYHAISTGYAGLLLARAVIESGRKAAITEHGIYTNERRIDLVTAGWIPDTIGTSIGKHDPRTDLRRFWVQAYEAYARLCYAACTRITTLYGENQTFQTALGAPGDKLEVIPNGIDIAKFAVFERGGGHPPTVALIGRVVPIKDIKTYIAAIGQLRGSVPGLRALVMGPVDEDPEYYQQCQRMAEELGLADTLSFTGKVNIAEHLPYIDVVVLTSISEAQPLVLLEAGAAGIPCVATDVGSCREIIEGPADEWPRAGAGGKVVGLMDPQAVAEAIRELLLDPELRQARGEALRTRVHRDFTSEQSAARYAALYRVLVGA